MKRPDDSIQLAKRFNAHDIALVVDWVDHLENQIREHHQSRGMDRCHENDKRLYHALGLEPGDFQYPPDPKVWMEGCWKYCKGIYPEEKIKALAKKFTFLEDSKSDGIITEYRNKLGGKFSGAVDYLDNRIYRICEYATHNVWEG